MRTEDVRAVEAFVTYRHMDFAGMNPERFYAYPGAVSRLAVRYAKRLFHNRIVEGKIRKIGFVECAGLLVYSMECYGCNFEDVARISDFGVAEIVATVSADPRETRAKRNLALRVQLSEGSLLAQLVKFAELEATAKRVYETFSRDDYRKDPVAVKDWVTDSEELLRAMHRLLARKRFGKPYQRLHAYLARIDHNLERAKRRLPELPPERLDGAALSVVEMKTGDAATPAGAPVPCLSALA